MDYRIKSFESEAVRKSAFLSELGFVSSAELPEDAHRRPLAVKTTFRTSDVEIETALVMEFGGDDAVVTTVRTVDGERRLKPRAARKTHEMTKALSEHAKAVRALLAERR